MLDVKDLSVSYGAVNALTSVTFSARPGAITAVLGANGAGKTTLLRTISGLVGTRSGSIRFDGEELLGRPVENIARRGVAHVPEGRGIIEELTVEENLRLATLWCMKHRERQAAIEATYELFPQLSPLHRRHASTLSGGERQMLVLGRALISRPRLLLLDEPASGLSNAEIDDLATLIRSLSDRMGVLVVEHHMDLVMSVCDRLVVLNFGRVIADGTPEVVRSNSEVTTAYLGDEIHDASVDAPESGDA